MRSRRDSNTAEFVKHWNRRESTAAEEPTVVVPVVVEGPGRSVSVFILCAFFADFALFLSFRANLYTAS